MPSAAINGVELQYEHQIPESSRTHRVFPSDHLGITAKVEVG